MRVTIMNKKIWITNQVRLIVKIRRISLNNRRKHLNKRCWLRLKTDFASLVNYSTFEYLF